MSNSASRLKPPSGLTLIELLVGLAVAAILSLVVVLAQSLLARQNANARDRVLMNNEARAALDVLTRDLTSAGFLLGGLQSRCALTLSYDSASPGTTGYSAQYPVWALNQAAGSTLPVPASPQAITFDYPPAGSAVQTQALFITAAPDASLFTASSSPQLYIVQFGTTQSGAGQGAVNSTQLPVSTLQLNSVRGIAAGDVALLQAPLNGNLVCFRIPIVKIGSATGQGASYIDSKPSPLMPSDGYSGFSNAMQQAGVGVSLSNAALLQSKILDLGQASTAMDTVIYYLARQGAYPVLMRAVVNTLTDQLLSSSPLAAGVVSLQTLFGVGQNGVSQYLPWSQVLAQGLADEVRSVRFALVAKTLHPDPGYTAPPQIAIPGPQGFIPYPVPPAYSHDHFSVYASEVALRNVLWPH